MMCVSIVELNMEFIKACILFDHYTIATCTNKQSHNQYRAICHMMCVAQ